MPSAPPSAPASILPDGSVPVGVWRGDLATEMRLSVDELILGKDPAISRNIHSNVTYPWSSEVFVPNANFFAPELRSQLTGVSMYNGAWMQSYGPTMITPRHAIICGHNGPGVGEPMRFVSADGSQIFNTTQLKRINDWSGQNPSMPSSDTKQTFVTDVSVILTSHEVPAWVYKAPILGNHHLISSGNSSQGSPPTLAVSQGNSTPVTQPDAPGAWTPNGRMLYVSHAHPGITPFSSRSAWGRFVWTGDSGTPDFILAGGAMWLYRIINSTGGYGAIVADHIDYINSLIERADASAGISTGYTVSVTDLEDIEFTNNYIAMPDLPVSILGSVSDASAPAAPVVTLPAVSGASAPEAPEVTLPAVSGANAPEAPVVTLPVTGGGLPPVMRITGMTWDGESVGEILTALDTVPTEPGRVGYSALNSDIFIWWDADFWVIEKDNLAMFQGVEDVATPDQVTTWLVDNEAGGTPVLTPIWADAPVSILPATSNDAGTQVLTISGTFTQSGGGALVFPELLYAGMEAGFPFYTATGLQVTGSGTEYKVAYTPAGGGWSITVSVNGGLDSYLFIAAASEELSEATPDLVNSWLLSDYGSGTPTLTLSGEIGTGPTAPASVLD